MHLKSGGLASIGMVGRAGQSGQETRHESSICDAAHFQSPLEPTRGTTQVPGETVNWVGYEATALLALQHLYELGHRDIAFMKGPSYSSDSAHRWTAMLEVAQELGIPVRPELTIELEGDLSTPEVAYPATKSMLQRQNKRFTALFAFNDNSALGAIAALQEAGVDVPGDVSVVGFDDIKIAPYSTPSLTTVRQPLLEMGVIAGQTLLSRIKDGTDSVPEILIEPQLILRNSTAKRP